MYASAPQQAEALQAEAQLLYRRYVAQRSTRPDFHYYSLLSIATLSEALSASWPVCKEEYMQAYIYDTTRGESIKKIILYYMNQQEWQILYIYSKFALAQWYNNPPTQKLFVDTPFYTWQILEIHFSAALRLGFGEEATQTLTTLHQLSQNHPHLFTQQEVERIQGHVNESEPQIPVN